MRKGWRLRRGNLERMEPNEALSHQFRVSLITGAGNGPQIAQMGADILV
jgi:hypothetical protein